MLDATKIEYIVIAPDHIAEWVKAENHVQGGWDSGRQVENGGNKKADA